MPVIPIQELDDPRIDVYRNLPGQLADRNDRFIVEGQWLVERLLDSSLDVDSLLVDPGRASDLADQVSAEVPVFVAEKSLLRQIVGFNFHRCAMACGNRPRAVAIDQLDTLSNRILVACEHVNDPENLGVIFRNCAAFGVSTVIVGRGSADPFSRRVIRVSMGTLFGLTIVESSELASDLEVLRERSAYEIIGSVLDDCAEPVSEFQRGQHMVLVVGNEGTGLSPDLLGVCNRRVTIPMRGGTDSLNVGVASGILLYEATRDLPGSCQE